MSKQLRPSLRNTTRLVTSLYRHQGKEVRLQKHAMYLEDSMPPLWGNYYPHRVSPLEIERATCFILNPANFVEHTSALAPASQICAGNMRRHLRLRAPFITEQNQPLAKHHRRDHPRKYSAAHIGCSCCQKSSYYNPDDRRCYGDMCGH